MTDKPEEEGDEIEVPDYVPLSFSLPKTGTIPTCPKCGQDAQLGTTAEYHACGILNAPCGAEFEAKDLKELGEHVCRLCHYCGYGWAERVND
jgi:hypothetical protein